MRATVRPAPVQPPNRPSQPVGTLGATTCARWYALTRLTTAWGLASILANALVGVVLAIWASVEVRDNSLIVVVTGDLSLA